MFFVCRWDAATEGAQPMSEHAYERAADVCNDLIADAQSGDNPQGSRAGAESASRLATRKLSEVQAERIQWLWYRRIPFRALTILASQPGHGKSTIAADIIARKTTGESWPLDTDRFTPRPTNVVAILGEDDVAMTFKPRIVAAGGDSERVIVVEAARAIDEQGNEYVRLFDTRLDADALIALVREYFAELVVVDPLALFLGSADQHKHSDTYRALQPLIRTAQETGAAILAVHHFNKGGSPTGSALARVMGSTAFGAAARSVFTAMKDLDSEDDDARILAHAKCNLARQQRSLRFRIVECDDVSRVVWCGICDKTADELVREESGGHADADNDDPSALSEACDWLRSVLAEGPLPAQEINRRARADSIAKRTLDRAKNELGVKARRSGFGKAGQWTWTLPAPHTAPSDTVLNSLAHNDDVGAQCDSDAAAGGP